MARATAPAFFAVMGVGGAVASRLQRLLTPGPSADPRLATGRAPPGAVGWNR